jgi:hypothetical protein
MLIFNLVTAIVTIESIRNTCQNETLLFSAMIKLKKKHGHNKCR